jgi:hypothetical protein
MQYRILEVRITRRQLKGIIRESLLSEALTLSAEVQAAIDHYQTAQGRLAWRMAANDMAQMAVGEDLEGLRQKYYADGGSNPDGSWSDSDFNAVYQAIEGTDAPDFQGDGDPDTDADDPAELRDIASDLEMWTDNPRRSKWSNQAEWEELRGIAGPAIRR